MAIFTKAAQTGRASTNAIRLLPSIHRCPDAHPYFGFLKRRKHSSLIAGMQRLLVGLCYCFYWIREGESEEYKEHR
ncbi:hypothetical protein MA16_Dca014172 [Dendrobium catenatum]|uniref:Uncharacterized protein n=1 Tax=Dendrobium catenatum TaxID=906689 RepID=A0A2I0VTM6_9ASPA|nr:hypothetical protein MA16_Dca014172 [Dendrobium catenatum]